MIIRGCISCFNEYEFIKLCVESLRPFVDEILVVDGPYEGYPTDLTHSNDGTLEWLVGKVDYLLVPGRPLPIKEKMSLFFEPPGADWYFHVDADEMVIGDADRLRVAIEVAERLGRPALEINLHNLGDAPVGLTHRVFKHVPGMRYARAHWEVWANDRLLYPTEHSLYAPSARLVHLARLRTPERLAAKAQYVRTRLSRREN